ncbi:GntR family transcriptional regulator [Primorskyibacter marinus]|uniref:GntR family transcriptional regulator n=1 Tax=Primorskyibacter marinus TaxID=1977320 RepID=UPI0018E54C9B|nr:GntR family transcriptional regulator [Primorskyibacter marinus]
MNNHASQCQSKLPAHEIVYRELRARVLFGEMAPGEAVTIQGIAETLNAGITPVREAIRRLIAESALVFQDNRRVIVPQLDAAAIEELVTARNALEPELARRAALRADAAAVRQLEAIDAQLDRAIAGGDVRGYLEQNYRFHDALYAQAAAPILRSLADGLWLRFGPSLRVVCGQFGTLNLPDRHKELIEALKTGDADSAARAIKRDVEQGMNQVRAALQA